MKKFNRLLSIAVAVVMAVVSAPLEVLANLQAPVLEGGITVSDSSPTARGSNTYTINVNWQKPPMSPNPDNRAVDSYRTDLHPIEGYELYRRNASVPEQYIAPEATVAEPTPDTTSENRQFSNLQLKGGSLFLFRAIPYHNHVFPLTETTTETRRANLDTGYKEGEAIYLTDISLTGKGRGNQMTVTWDNPTIDGMDVFTSYRISYVLQGTTTVDVIPDTNNITVATSDATPVADGKLEYTFIDPRLVPGLYSIKIEPMYGGQLFRRLQQINFNGKNYSVASTSREYRSDDAYVEIALYVEPIGSDYLRLYWDRIIAQDIERIEIHASETEDFSGISRPIGILLGDSARDVTSFITDMPDDLTYYKLVIFYKDRTDVDEGKSSEIRPYDPYYTDFHPYNPRIIDITDSGEPPYTLKVFWDPFIRKAYNSDKLDNPDEMYLDKNITYDMWVTDDPSNFNDSAFRTRVSASLPALGLNVEEVLVDEENVALGTKPAYTHSLTSYYKKNLDGTYSEVPFTENKIYYVSIVARRNTTEEQRSQEATGQHFLPPRDPVAPKPVMTSRPPLRIMTDENGKMITQNSITVQCDLRWFEAYDAASKTWYPLSQSGAGQPPELDYNLQNTIPYGQDILDGLGFNPTTDERQSAIKMAVDRSGFSPIRLMDLYGSDYQIHVARDDYVHKNGGYEAYLNALSVSNNSSDWEPNIPPSGDEMHPYFTVTNENKPTAGNLAANTAYVIFFRAITKTGDEYAWYPNYVTATTMETRGPVDVDPTVPLLEPVSESDTYLVVRWEYSDVLKYELRYSDLLSDYSGGGTAITWEQIQENGEFSTEGDKRYITYTIRNLFPETSYNIWIRSIAPSSTGDRPSKDWSNPIYMTTTEVVKPDPPKGLGLASKDSIGAYNKENNTKYTPIDTDYMVVEWQRNYADTVASTTGAAAGGGDAKFLSSPSLLSSYMALFENLKANLTYYVRAKTILVVTKQNDGVAKNFYYVVEVADNPDFLDAKRIQVPGNTVTGDPVYTITKESDWSTTVYFVTSPSTGEYDSDKNDNMYPLPTQDYEIIYNAETETLTYRFRTNGKDASGANDNGVDQRFITKLVKNRTYTYDLDLSKYDGKVITRRTVELPYSIYKAFEERKINFKLTADNITVTIPPGAMNTKEVTGIKDFGVNAKVNVTLTKNAAGTPALATGEVYSSAPQKLSVQVVSPTRTVQLPLLAKPLNIDMKLDHRYDTLDKNVGSYMADVNTVGWERANSQYNNLTGVMTLATDRVMNYSVVAKNLPFVAVQDDSIDAFYNVTSRLNITDMGSYDPSANVTATQFNNIVAAIAKGKLSVAIDADLPAAELQSLTKSKLAAVSGGTVSREAGIASLVRLYELKTKSAVKGYPSINETGYPDIATAQQAYQTPLLKAEYLGLYGERPQVAPKAALTLGEMLKIIDIIISDAGL